ncbi:MAG: NAD-dependent succinate-semialdehyde dehydrogenase [Acidobacteriota bacterium]
MSLESINPATGESVATYAEHTDEEVIGRVERCALAQIAWRDVPIEQRAVGVEDLARALMERQEDLARLMAAEMGKPLPEGRAEVEKCAWVCRHYAEQGPAMLATEEVDLDGVAAEVLYRPLGVVLAVMPWNYPLWQVFRFLAPALVAGNGVLLKHAANVTGCALAIEEIFDIDDFMPDDLFRALLVGSSGVMGVMENSRVKAVTLTGSTSAGRAVGALAGRTLKKSVLELGGSDPYLILPDADLDRAVECCMARRLANSGQSCVAAKRLIVCAEVLEDFTARLVAAMSAKTFGDPLAGDFDLGPMARVDLRDELHRQVQRSVEAGAKLLLGGQVPEGPGAFYPPTVLADVRRGCPAWDEELFGPVAAILPVAHVQEAVDVANESVYGLGAAVFSQDLVLAESIARHGLDAGSVAINDAVRSDPRLPFGGIKESGYGRELGLHGIREFVNVKSVVGV